jgi:hypothetical protein
MLEVIFVDINDSIMTFIFEPYSHIPAPTVV